MLHDSSEGRALLRAVLCEPEDDAPRLILADWLDEHGDSNRADLIRRMCRMPSCVFTWSRRNNRGRLVHNETPFAIRGLRDRLRTLCHDEWKWREDIHQVIIHRGFASTLAMQRVKTFLRTAISIFGLHPIQQVTFRDLDTMSSFEGDEYVEARLVHQDYRWEAWPVAFYPGRQIDDRLIYRSTEAAMADMSQHACAYGRRLAMIPVEPPPLPVRRARQTMQAVAPVRAEWSRPQSAMAPRVTCPF